MASPLTNGPLLVRLRCRSISPSTTKRPPMLSRCFGGASTREEKGGGAWASPIGGERANIAAEKSMSGFWAL